MSKWVRNKYNEHAEKWEVKDQLDGLQAWFVKNKNAPGFFYLPWSEYVECSPPETWNDVTEQCEADRNRIQVNDVHWPASNQCWKYLDVVEGYRLRKVALFRAHPDSNLNCAQQAFIVEKRQP